MDEIISALSCIPVKDCSYAEWLGIGMALKDAGYEYAVWDEWSKNDKRYIAGDCERRWASFKGSEHPITVRTIRAMARKNGWISAFTDFEDTQELTPCEMLIRYLETLFQPYDIVGFATQVTQDSHGKLKPINTNLAMRASDFIARLHEGKDIDAVIGPYRADCGAWIRMNPLDGKGQSDRNVSAYRYVLIESDELPREEQERVYRKYELPIAALVDSAGKSVHAVVRIDAPDEQEYRRRVNYLFRFLELHGFPVDNANKNPSRLSRMPGVLRDGVIQELLVTNIGKHTWGEWLEYAEELALLPEPIRLCDVETPPLKPPELIRGILRRGHKMLIAGPSKAGKSFLLIELAIAIAEGSRWLGFTCVQGKVLYAFQNIVPHLAQGASAYIFHADTEGLTFRRAFKEAGFHISGVCIWVKNTMVLGRSPYQWQHEPVLYGWLPNGNHKWFSDRKQTTVWNFDRPTQSRLHPTMKPIPLLAYPIVSGTAPAAPTEDMLWLDTSQSPAVLKRWTGSAWEAVNEAQVGGVNLIVGSTQYTLVADGSDSYWIAADELEPGTAYTLSVREVVLVDGSTAGVTWKVVDQSTGSVHTSGMLDFTYGKQIRHFTVPNTSGNWALYLYAGISGSTTGVTVQFNKIQLEEGTTATSWRVAAEENDAVIGQLQGDVSALDAGMEERVNALIEEMGLSEQFASAEAFLAAVGEIELLRSEMAQTDSDLTLMFSRLLVAEGNITQMYSSFVFGDDDGQPYLDMSASASSIKMRLTNTRLAFVQSGTELAYFSDNKLYVTRLEVVEQISIGTAANGYLDMVTTPTGVGFKWRS